MRVLPLFPLLLLVAGCASPNATTSTAPLAPPSAPPPPSPSPVVHETSWTGVIIAGTPLAALRDDDAQDVFVNGTAVLHVEAGPGGSLRVHIADASQDAQPPFDMGFVAHGLVTVTIGAGDSGVSLDRSWNATLRWQEI